MTDPTEKAIEEFRDKTGFLRISPGDGMQDLLIRETDREDLIEHFRTALKQAQEEWFEKGKNAAADYFQKHVIDIPDHAKFYGMKSIVDSVRSLPLPTND